MLQKNKNQIWKSLAVHTSTPKLEVCLFLQVWRTSSAPAASLDHLETLRLCAPSAKETPLGTTSVTWATRSSTTATKGPSGTTCTDTNSQSYLDWRDQLTICCRSISTDLTIAFKIVWWFGVKVASWWFEAVKLIPLQSLGPQTLSCVILGWYEELDYFNSCWFVQCLTWFH